MPAGIARAGASSSRSASGGPSDACVRREKAAGRHAGGLFVSPVTTQVKETGMHRTQRLVLTAVVLTLLSGVLAQGAPPQEARERVVAATLEYAETLYSPSYALVVDEMMRPDYARFSAGYVVAALHRDEVSEQVLGTLRAILAAQDLASGSPTLGFFPQDAYAPAPSLEATCYLLPLLAWAHGHAGDLPTDLQDQIKRALESAYRAVEKAKAPPDHPYLALLRGAALATAGQALSHPEGLAAAQAVVSTWLKEQLTAGCWQGLGATAESLRLGALAWIAQAAGERASPDVQMALRLGYMSLVQRVQPGSGALAGAASFVQAVDYLQGGDLSRALLYLWGVGEEPRLLRPSAMYLAACQWVPGLPPLEAAPEVLPRTVTTLAREGAPVVRTDTYVTADYSLGTYSGNLGTRAIPLLVTLATGGTRPTAYFFAQPTPASVAAVQDRGRAVVTVAFNQIGAPGREQAWLHGVLGPRADVDQVLVDGRPWNGEASAVGAGSVVAWQRGKVYLGVRLGLTGPARTAQRTETTKPGTLRWQGEAPTSELELLIYGRKQTYGLQPALDYVLVGVSVRAAGPDEFADLESFARQMAAERLTQTVSASSERIAPQEDPHTAFLNENKPRTRTQYQYVDHLVLDSKLQSEPPLLAQRWDLASGRLLGSELAGVSLGSEGPLQSPGLVLPWDQAAARQALAALPSE